MTAGSESDEVDRFAAASWATDAAVKRIGFTCRTATEGRRAVRALAEWARRFDLSEPDFQVLWCLHCDPADGIDQTTLAKKLACSAAQVSATVERMRSRGWIEQRESAGDRRRNVWQFTECGNQILHKMLAAAGYLPCWESQAAARGIRQTLAGEDAA